MNFEAVVSVLAVALLTGVAALGAWCNRYHGGLVLCALIPLAIVSFVIVGYLDSFFAESASLKKADIVEYGPGFAATVLPIYLAGTASLIRLYRRNKEALEKDHSSASNS